MPRHHVRIAFDIGSGATKFLITVAKPDGQWKALHSEQVEVLVGHALQNNAQGILDSHILEAVECAIEKGVRVARRLGAEFAQSTAAAVGASGAADDGVCGVDVYGAGVATAAFRNARNGREWIAAFAERTGIALRTAEQEEEGNMGFEAACGASGVPPERVVSWDSGGASFQIACITSARELPCVYEGKWGSSSSTACMVERVQKRNFAAGESANPVNEQHVQTLHDLITDSLTEPLHSPIKEKLKQEATEVVAMGGETCAFRIASMLLGGRTLTPEGIGRLLHEECIDRDDAYFTARAIPQVEMVVPKLVLVRAVMMRFGIASATYWETNGLTAAILNNEVFWGSGRCVDASFGVKS